MRKIKVRAWHVSQQKMYSAEELGKDQLTLSADGRGFVNVGGQDTLKSHFFDEDMIPLEWIGEEDKNGIEIYEEDIVKSITGEVYTIIFDNGAFRTKSHQAVNLIYARVYANQDCVIGNTFENKELIND